MNYLNLVKKKKKVNNNVIYFNSLLQSFSLGRLL